MFPQAAQMEELVKSVDKELNFSKKGAKVRVQGAGHDPPLPLSLPPLSSLSSRQPQLEVERVRERFVETEVTKTMTIHHQLLAMKRYCHTPSSTASLFFLSINYNY